MLILHSTELQIRLNYKVSEGLDIVKRIQKTFTDDYVRPVDDIRILRTRIVE